MEQADALLTGLSIALVGGVGSLLAEVATGVGALPVLFLREVGPRVEAVMLGLGAGVMLAATSFSLVLPGIEAARDQEFGRAASALIVGAGILIGGCALWLANRYAPHEHFIKGPEGRLTPGLGRVWLFVIAITLHNFPEGLAVGSASAATTSATA